MTDSPSDSQELRVHDETDITTPPIALWSLGGLKVRQVFLRTWRAYRAGQMDARSAQFAYFSLLALAPLVIVTIACVAQLPINGVVETFLRTVNLGLPHNAEQIIVRQVRDVQKNSSLGLIVVGLGMLAFAGTRLFLTMGAAFDSAYHVARRRRLWKSSGLALAVTIGVFVLLIVAMVLLVIGPKVTAIAARFVTEPWVLVLLSSGVRWGIACGFMLLSASVIYWLTPSVMTPFYWVSPGSLFATLGWLVVTQGTRIYVENFGRYNETYGALAGVIVLMIWLYMTGSVLLTGGLINCVIQKAAESKHLAENSHGNRPIAG